MRTAPRRARRQLPPALRHYLPRVAGGIALVCLGVGAYIAARETSVFAVRKVEIKGGSTELQAQVRDALAPELGRSLVKVSGGDVRRRLAAVPGVLSVSADRHFPHTLRVVVTPERPVLLLRRGKDGWVVSARGRVLRAVADPRPSSLPRLWVPTQTKVTVNEMLAPQAGGTVATVLAPLTASKFPARVRAVRAKDAELTLVLRSGLQLRLGDAGDLRLKLAVARRLLLIEGPDPADSYIDVSVPERPVVGT